jgi:glycosyltransferase involved in cell wall biosynthesis
MASSAAAEETATIDWTIAIPTFRRPALLGETVASVLAQTNLAGVELIIIDNDPESKGAAALLAAIPALHTIPFRYFRNSINVGMFGNWNACLTLARGTWVTVLNDDDLLDPQFVATMRGALHDDPTIDAIACSYRFMDCRTGGDDKAPVPRREQIRNIFRFGLRDRRQIQVRWMFFGSITGSSLGLVVRRAVALAIGGFHSAEYPSADYYFAARLARGYRFVQLRAALAVVRVAENESARPETLAGFVHGQGALQNAMLGHEAPGWWRWFQPPSLYLALIHLNRFWRASLDPTELGQTTGLPIASRGARMTKVARLLMRAI